MQVIYLPVGWTIFLCFLLWPLIQYMAAYLCHKLPEDFYKKDHWLFTSRTFEKNGQLYGKVFRVHRWKHLLPDGSIKRKDLRYKKKHLSDFSVEGLEKFLVESRRAELTHWIPIPFFWVFGLFTPLEVIFYMFLYAGLVNLPCILVQRYNRPRVEKLLMNKKKRRGLS